MNIIVESPVIGHPMEIKKKSDDKVRFNAVLQTTGDINRNFRSYDKETLQESIDKIYDRIKGREFLGELDHPIDSNPSRQVTVSFKEVSHLILDMGWDGNKLIGVLETASTPNGYILNNLITKDKVPVGFSYRGMGDVKQISESSGRPVYKVVGPLTTITWDSVSFPSHKEAKITEITESVNRAIMESIDPMNITYESNDYICLENGICVLPNTFDKLVEQRINNLRNRFRK